MAELAENLLHDLAIEEPMIVEGTPLAPDETEAAVVRLLEPIMGKDQTVPRTTELLTYVRCPGECDITHTVVDGVTSWTGIHWFSCMEIQSLTKHVIMQGLENMYGAPTGCGAEECNMSRLFALQQMDKPVALPCIEKDCG